MNIEIVVVWGIVAVIAGVVLWRIFFNDSKDDKDTTSDTSDVGISPSTPNTSPSRNTNISRQNGSGNVRKRHSRGGYEDELDDYEDAMDMISDIAIAAEILSDNTTSNEESIKSETSRSTGLEISDSESRRVAEPVREVYTPPEPVRSSSYDSSPSYDSSSSYDSGSSDSGGSSD